MAQCAFIPYNYCYFISSNCDFCLTFASISHNSNFISHNYEFTCTCACKSHICDFIHYCSKSLGSKIFILSKCHSFELSRRICVFSKILSSVKLLTVFNTDNKKCSWAPNQNIKQISEGLCDTEDWSNGCCNFSFTITGIIYILNYIKIDRNYIKLYYFTILLLYFYFSTVLIK